MGADIGTHECECCKAEAAQKESSFNKITSMNTKKIDVHMKDKQEDISRNPIG